MLNTSSPDDQPREFSLDETITDEVVCLSAGGANGKDREVLISRKQVFKMAQLGALNKEISDFFGINTRTLTNHFETELRAGRSAIKLRLRQKMLQEALKSAKPNPAILIFLAKNYLAMSDNGMTEDLDTQEGVEFKVKAPAKPTTPIQEEDESADA